MLPTHRQQLLHLEHIACACVGASLKHNLREWEGEGQGNDTGNDTESVFVSDVLVQCLCNPPSRFRITLTCAYLLMCSCSVFAISIVASTVSCLPRKSRPRARAIYLAQVELSSDSPLQAKPQRVSKPQE